MEMVVGDRSETSTDESSVSTDSLPVIFQKARWECAVAFPSFILAVLISWIT